MEILYVILIIFALLSFVGIYFFYYSTFPKFSSKKLFKKGNNSFLSDEASKSWFNNINYKDVFIDSFDKKKLHAYEIENSSNVWVIILHGYTNSGLDMLSIAKNFYCNNFSILLVDLRAHGLSEGSFSAGGFLERKDTLSWINYLSKKNNSKIVLYGISMGGTIVLRTVGLNLPDNVICAIDDSGFLSNYKQMYSQLSFKKLPAKLIIFLSNIISKIVVGFDVYKFDPVKELKKGKVPMLFIHGKNDKLVPSDNSKEAYNIYKGKKEILFIEEAKHMKSSIVNPKLYYNTIFNFIKKQS